MMKRCARIHAGNQAVVGDAMIALRDLADVIHVIAVELQQRGGEVEHLPVDVSQIIPDLRLLAELVERPAKVSEVRRVENGEWLAAELIVTRCRGLRTRGRR